MARRLLLNDHLKESIRQRYAPVSQIGADNELLMEIFDKEAVNKNFRELSEKINNKVIFNPNIAMLFPRYWKELRRRNFIFEFIPYYLFNPKLVNYMKHMGHEDVFERNYFFTKTLKKLWTEISKKKYTLVVVGYGGAMFNLLNNLSFMSMVSEKLPRLFERIIVFENDEVEFSNILRFGAPIINIGISRFDDSYNNFKKINLLEKQLLQNKFFHLFKNQFQAEDEYFTIDKAKEILENYENVIFIGAPDFETRQALYEMSAPFLMVGHSNNTISITKCPKIEGLITETYGSIDIPVLLLNLYGA
ncbi:MAG: hypothetical protein GXO49_05865, partial [Chlorobi bacterium]|nr:hypothetical protein [Chlorobiota bacterium]